MADLDACSPEALLGCLHYLEREARSMGLHFESHLIGVAALAVLEATASQLKKLKGRSQLTITATISNGQVTKFDEHTGANGSETHGSHG